MQCAIVDLFCVFEWQETESHAHSSQDNRSKARNNKSTRYPRKCRRFAISARSLSPSTVEYQYNRRQRENKIIIDNLVKIVLVLYLFVTSHESRTVDSRHFCGCGAIVVRPGRLEPHGNWKQNNNSIKYYSMRPVFFFGAFRHQSFSDK